ncbi:MAG: hypothetical protein MN733_32860, partial [Nitrososphaera sp.]|nr:hypothetical protein [Nitrososphaera sp.]
MAAKKKGKKKEGPERTEAQVAGNKRQKLMALMNKINREAGIPALRFADDDPNPYYLRRPCGIMQLDIDMGGGAPAGGLSTVCGPDNAGKSLLLYMFFAMHQRLYSRESYIGYCIPEGGID